MSYRAKGSRWVGDWGDLGAESEASGKRNEIAGNRDHRSENVRLSILWRFLIPRVYSGNGCPKRCLNVFSAYIQ